MEPYLLVTFTRLEGRIKKIVMSIFHFWAMEQFQCDVVYSTVEFIIEEFGFPKIGAINIQKLSSEVGAVIVRTVSLADQFRRKQHSEKLLARNINEALIDQQPLFGYDTVRNYVSVYKGIDFMEDRFIDITKSIQFKYDAPRSLSFDVQCLREQIDSKLTREQLRDMFYAVALSDSPEDILVKNIYIQQLLPYLIEYYKSMVYVNDRMIVKSLRSILSNRMSDIKNLLSDVLSILLTIYYEKTSYDVVKETEALISTIVEKYPYCRARLKEFVAENDDRRGWLDKSFYGAVPQL